jgi:hypothetical protein
MIPEAFVYCWTDRATNQLYIGWHKGTFDDGYICSSKYMKEQYLNRPNDFTREIIASGSCKDMTNLETQLLRSVDAKNDDQFYNRHNGDGCYRYGKHTEETKRKISEINTGAPRSQKHRDKISKALTGKSYLTEEGRKKKSEYAKLRPPKKGAKESEQAKANKRAAFAKSEKHGANFKNKSSEMIEKMRQTKKQLRKLVAPDSSDYKMAKKDSDKWNQLIEMGYTPLNKVGL